MRAWASRRHAALREHGTVSPTPAEQRTPSTRTWHTEDLPPTPQRDFLIPASQWVEAPDELLVLGRDLGIDLVMYIRRIGRYLLWRAGPAVDSDARYMAIAADDLTERWTFRLLPDGTGRGDAPGGDVHARFRTWKEALRDASAAHDREEMKAQPTEGEAEP